MVKKQAAFLIIIFLSFIIAQTEVLAQSTTSAALNTKGGIKEQFIQQKRIDAQQKFKAKREAFQQKVATIKDEKKRQLIERIDNKLSTVNTNRTNQITENLEKLVKILGNIQEKTTTAKENGKDISSVTAAITKAQTAIDNAKTAVQTQAGKEYVITITATGSGQLKNSVGITTKQLQADLSITHKLMVAAKQAVQQAHLALTKVLGIPVTKQGTSSATAVTQ